MQIGNGSNGLVEIQSTIRRNLFLLLLAIQSLSHAADQRPIRDGFIQVPGGPVWYRITGNGTGVPLLALHGGPGGTSCKFANLEPMSVDRPLIRYDQLGTGRSGRPDDPRLWTLERFVSELDAVRNELGLDRMHLLGHSWGGAVAAQYVLTKGDAGIVSLTLSSPLLSTRAWIEDANILRLALPDDVQQVLAQHEVAGTTDSREYIAATEVFYTRHVWAGERPAGTVACAGAPGNSFVYEYMWGPTEFYATGNLLDFDLSNRLGELRMPVLLIAGEFDEARPNRMREFQKKIPNAELIVIDGSAHATIDTNPDQYMKAVGNFLSSAETEIKSD